MATTNLRPVESLVYEHLATAGRLSFAEFMELVLYAPQGGYYTSQEVLGESGDYVTSAELHPAFGALLGRQVEDCWRALGRPGEFRVREFGAGRGVLCRDLLRWVRAAAPELAESLVYEIVERSPGLRARQEETLERAGLSERVCWLDSMSASVAGSATRAGLWPAFSGDLPGLVGCVLSNELLDSFPVHLVTLRDGQLRELYVTLGAQGLRLESGEPSRPELDEYFERLGVRPGEGCQAEVNLQAVEWMASVAASLERGLVLTLDYGYPAAELYSPRRRQGTLLCYYRHTLSSDPLQRLGRQDITSHVDFTTLAQTGERHGLATIGLISQARLLTNLGLPAYLERMEQLRSPEREANRRALTGLLDPDGLGWVGALLQQREMDDYVPLAVRPDAPPPAEGDLPLLEAGGLRLPSPEDLEGASDFEKMWNAFVSGDESELDDG